MKKYFGILLAAMLMVGAAGHAMAMISAPNLIRIVYQGGPSGTVEIGSDLGVAASSLSAGTITTNPFSLPTGLAWSDLNVAYVAFAGPTSSQLWFTATSTPNINTLTWTQARTGINNVSQNYTAGMTTVGARSAGKSYWNSLDKGGVNGAIGGLNSFITQSTNNLFGVEANLAALATGGAGFVDQTLYTYVNGTQTLSDTGFTLRTLSNGTTQVVASAVPIPPSVLLLGSGLLGMIGIRRKIA